MSVVRWNMESHSGLTKRKLGARRINRTRNQAQKVVKLNNNKKKAGKKNVTNKSDYRVLGYRYHHLVLDLPCLSTHASPILIPRVFSQTCCPSCLRCH